MRRIMMILIVIGMMGPSGLHADGYIQGYSSSYALVVGIDKYRRWPHLEYAVKDAREVAALLKTRGFQLHMLTDENATGTNILRELDDHRKICRCQFPGRGLLCRSWPD